MRQATTDKDGRFRLEGFGADRVVGLELQGGTIAYTTIDVATRKMDPIPAAGFSEHARAGARDDLRGRLHLHRGTEPPDRRRRERRQDGSTARGRRDSQLPVSPGRTSSAS